MLDSAGCPSTKRTRVIILATLVEAQLLASSLLTAVGLRHEVLVSDAGRRSTAHSSRHGPARSASCSVESGYATAWAWSQGVISQFNNSGGEERSIDIIIASPRAISSHNGGIGATSADAVISIDEDWSGREAFHVASILAKMRGRDLGAGTAPLRPCKFIKIVCRNTCEDTFLRPVNYGTKTKLGRGSNQEASRSSCVIERRSVRAVLNANQDESESDDDEIGFGNTAEARKTMLLGPLDTRPEENLTNGDGFLVPPTNGDEDARHKSSYAPNNNHLIGANILRYRNCKSSSVFCSTQVIGSSLDRPLLPTERRLQHRATPGDRDVTFAWALYNAEEYVSYVSTAGRPQTMSWSPEVNYELRSIALGSSVMSFLVDVAPVQRYLESFNKSSSFISQGRGEKQMQLLHLDGNQSTNGAIASVGDAPSNVSPDSPSTTNCSKEADAGDSDAALLVYGPPSSVSRKRKILDAESPIEKGVFSNCFSSFDRSTSALAGDSNQGCEPLVYFPSFLPSLLQMIGEVTHTEPGEYALSGAKRKDIAEELDSNTSKRSRMSPPP